MSATAVLNLSKAGFTDAQVEALAGYFGSHMATKARVEKIRFDIEKVRSDHSVKIEQLRSSLELQKRRAVSQKKIAGVALQVSERKVDVIKWVAGLMIAQGAAIVALVRLLPGMHR
ncbi:MAG TPA: hypothetical protein VHW66_13870 [Stellaceae bacterium]|jgi:hypothetical protein|nr:hypothetical protein [Stellaceae bacterium]